MPYVVFLQSPDFEVLKAMNQSAAEAGVVAKTLTVRNTCIEKRSCDSNKSPVSNKVTCFLSQDEELQRTCDESAKIQAAFGHYFDLSIINDNLDETYRTVKAALETVSKNPQWVPVTWVF